MCFLSFGPNAMNLSNIGIIYGYIHILLKYKLDFNLLVFGAIQALIAMFYLQFHNKWGWFYPFRQHAFIWILKLLILKRFIYIAHATAGFIYLFCNFIKKI